MRKSLAEGRRYRRYEFHSAFRATRVCAGSVQKACRNGSVRGEIQNASAGGLGVVTKKCMKEFELVRAEIPFHSLPVKVPTLMQVRWVSHVANTTEHRIGLQFLI